MATISHITLPDNTDYSIQATGIFSGQVDSTSTSTVYTATIPGVTEYYDGLTILLKNGIVTSTFYFTININGLGAKPVYSNMAAAEREHTTFNKDYTWLLIYDSTRVEGGCWINYRGYYVDSNSIGFQLRTNSTILKTADASRYYRLFFTSADGTHWVPANTAKDDSATSAKTVNQRPIDPYGRIFYYNSSTDLSAESDVPAAYCWNQYLFTLGYSFNRTGEALTLTTKTPVYIKCAPQADGSAIIDSTTPYVQALPSTEDGKIYIFLGIAYSATMIELALNHPVYWYKNGHVRQWTNSNKTEQTYNGNSSMSYTSYTNSIVNGDIAEFSCTSGSNKAFIYAAYDDSGECPVIVLGGYTSTNGNKNSLFVDPSGEITIHNLSAPVQNTDAATKGYVDNNFMTGMTILSYGISTWSDFIAAYSSNRVIYCRASSNSNPASGSQTRLAFMAYVNNATTPTEVEFQYYRSVSTHTESQQGDQVYVYKLNKNNGWSVITREASVKVAYNNGITGTYSNGVMTLKHANTAITAQSTQAVYPIAIDAYGHITGYGSAVTIPEIPSVTASDNGKILTVVNGAWAAADLPTYQGGVS